MVEQDAPPQALGQLRRQQPVLLFAQLPQPLPLRPVDQDLIRAIKLPLTQWGHHPPALKPARYLTLVHVV